MFGQEVAADGVGGAGYLELIETQSDRINGFPGEAGRDVEADKAAGGEVGIAAGADIQGVVAVVVAGAEAV